MEEKEFSLGGFKTLASHLLLRPTEITGTEHLHLVVPATIPTMRLASQASEMTMCKECYVGSGGGCEFLCCCKKMFHCGVYCGKHHWCVDAYTNSVEHQRSGNEGATWLAVVCGRRVDIKRAGQNGMAESCHKVLDHWLPFHQQHGGVKNTPFLPCYEMWVFFLFSLLSLRPSPKAT